MAGGQGFWGGRGIVLEMITHPCKTFLLMKDLVKALYSLHKDPMKFKL